MKKENELYKPVLGLEGKYEISSFGNVRSLTRYIHDTHGMIRTRLRIGKKLRLVNHPCGYLHVALGRERRALVHVLILEAFVEPRPLGLQACHRNDVKTDNVLDNLYWGTRKENMKDAKLNNRLDYSKQAKGEHNWNAKVTEKDVITMRSSYIPGSPEFGMKALAKRFNISHWTIGSIIRCETWKHI